MVTFIESKPRTIHKRLNSFAPLCVTLTVAPRTVALGIIRNFVRQLQIKSNITLLNTATTSPPKTLNTKKYPYLHLVHMNNINW